MTITYKKGNLFDNLVEDKKNIILHVCNDAGGWGSGFVISINEHCGPKPEAKYRTWYATKEYKLGGLGGLTYRFKLGQVQFVKVKDSLVVCNMLAQSCPGGRSYSYFGRKEHHVPFRPESFRECLFNVAEALDKHGKLDTINLCSPLMGCGLAGGDKKEVFGIVDDVFGKEIDLTVWEL